MWNDILKAWSKSDKNTQSKRIAQHLLDLDKDVLATNLTKEAKKLNVAPSTITKFLNKAGYSGWKMYTAIALLNVNRKQQEIRDKLLGRKIEISAWIDLVYTGLIDTITKKILKSTEIVLLAHNTSKSVLEMFKRNLSILGFNIDIRDISDKYVRYPSKVSSVTLLFSLTGNNLFLKNANSIIKAGKFLGSKFFVSPSQKILDGADDNINLNGSSIELDKMENIFPVLKVHFVNHILDKIQKNIIAKKQDIIDKKYLDSKMWNK